MLPESYSTSHGGVMSPASAGYEEPARPGERGVSGLVQPRVSFCWPIAALLTGVVSAGVLLVLPFLWRSNIPYGASPVSLRIGAGCLLLLLGTGAVLATVADLPRAHRWVAAWVAFGIVATAYARGGTLALPALALAVALGGMAIAILGANRAWKGFWFPSRRNALNLNFIWATFGVMVVVGASLSGALRQAAALGLCAPFLTPWGARLLGALLRGLAATTRGALDWGIAIYGLTVLMLAAGALYRPAGAIPHIPIAAGEFTISLHDLARWSITIAFALYVARRPVFDRWMRNRLFVALGVVGGLILLLRERYTLVLLGAALSVIATTVWGLRRTALPVLLLLLMGLGVAVILGRSGERLPQQRLQIAIGSAENAELNRARLAIRTAGWTGISGAHLERLSVQSVTDYAVSAIALNYGRLGLLFAILVTFCQVMLLYVASAQLRDVPARLVALAMVSNIGLQAVLPILALTPWPIPYGGVPWCIAARSNTQLVLQTLSSSAIIGAVSSQDRGEE